VLCKRVSCASFQPKYKETYCRTLTRQIAEVKTKKMCVCLYTSIYFAYWGLGTGDLLNSVWQGAANWSTEVP